MGRVGKVFRSELRNKTRHIATMHEENNTLKETLRKQETQINKMNDEVEGMQTKLQGLQMEADVRDAELRKAQEAAFHQMKGGNWMPLEDSAIRSEFQELERAIRGWARTYSTSNVLAPDSVSPEDIEQMNYLLDRNIWDRNNTFPVSLSNWPHQNRAPRLLVHAVISQCVFEHIFNDPFYFLKDQGIGSQKESIERMGEHLNHLYNVVQEGRLNLTSLAKFPMCPRFLTYTCQLTNTRRTHGVHKRSAC